MTIPLPENTGPAGYNDFVPQPVSGWTSSIRNGNQSVTDSAGSRQYKLNETASLVLQLCDGKCTNREIIDTVDDLYESDPTCVSDVISVLSSLKNAGLISNYPSVTFATACWENDWRQLLLDETYLPCLMIDHHSYNFQERLLLINNVIDTAVVARHAQELVSKQILTSVHNTADTAEQMLEFFGLSRSLFVARHESQQELNVDDEWIYYNALAPLSAIYRCTTDYLLYMTGDCFLREPVDWIGPALRLLEENASYKVANPTWNDCYEEASRQSVSSPNR
jgi:hypothetical protein